MRFIFVEYINNKDIKFFNGDVANIKINNLSYYYFKYHLSKDGFFDRWRWGFDSFNLFMVGKLIVKIDLVIVVQCVISMIDDMYMRRLLVKT